MYILKKLNRETTASTKEEVERLVFSGWKVISGEDKDISRKPEEKNNLQELPELDEEFIKEEQQQPEQEKPKRTSKKSE